MLSVIKFYDVLGHGALVKVRSVLKYLMDLEALLRTELTFNWARQLSDQNKARFRTHQATDGVSVATLTIAPTSGQHLVNWSIGLFIRRWAMSSIMNAATAYTNTPSRARYPSPKLSSSCAEISLYERRRCLGVSSSVS